MSEIRKKVILNIDALAYTLYKHGVSTFYKDENDELEIRIPSLKLAFSRSNYLKFDEKVNTIIFEDAIYVGYVRF